MTAVAELMAAVRALPPLSMEAKGAAARLALPQIGCSNPRCVAAYACFKQRCFDLSVSITVMC